eukprot:Nk52_evm11s1992 gene=Nk52_evmTU11s1992
MECTKKKRSLWRSLKAAFKHGDTGEASETQKTTVESFPINEDENIYEVYGAPFMNTQQERVVAVSKKQAKQGKAVMKFKASYYFNQREYGYEKSEKGKGGEKYLISNMWSGCDYISKGGGKSGLQRLSRSSSRSSKSSRTSSQASSAGQSSYSFQ